MKRLTHKQKILNYLEQGNELTVLKAMYELNCGSLSSQISQLRKAGYPIENRWAKNTTNNGQHAIYFINKRLQEKKIDG